MFSLPGTSFGPEAFSERHSTCNQSSPAYTLAGGGPRVGATNGGIAIGPRSLCLLPCIRDPPKKSPHTQNGNKVFQSIFCGILLFSPPFPSCEKRARLGFSKNRMAARTRTQTPSNTVVMCTDPNHVESRRSRLASVEFPLCAMPRHQEKKVLVWISVKKTRLSGTSSHLSCGGC